MACLSNESHRVQNVRERLLINEGPSGYSASVVGKDGSVYVLYERGDKVYYDNGVSIVRLDPEWLLKANDE